MFLSDQFRREERFSAADDKYLEVMIRLDIFISKIKGIEKTRTGRVDVVGKGPGGAQLLLHQAGAGGHERVRGHRRHQNQADFLDADTGCFEGLSRRLRRQGIGLFALPADASRLDAGPALNPFVRGLDDLFQIMIGDYLCRQRRTGA